MRDNKLRNNATPPAGLVWRHDVARWRPLLALALALAAGLSGGSAAQAADLTLTIGGRVTIELVTSVAEFSNTLSVVSPTVAVGVSGCALEPATGLGGVLILSEKRSQRGCRVELDADTGTAGIQPFAAGTTFNFGFCAQTDSDAACEFVWSSSPASNSDSFDHVQTTPLLAGDFPGRIFQLAWEDLEGGGDRDFNDLIAVLRVDIDSDGDGLWDDWEQNGVDTTGDGVVDLDLPGFGADPMHKDIFLEIDFMDCAVAGGDCVAGDTHSHIPKAAAVNAVVQAFADAPVTNPDGLMGIDIHIETGNATAHQNLFDIPGPCGGSPLPAGVGNFDTAKADPANFGPTNPRRFAYHYQIFNHRRGANTTSSGCSELPGNDTITSLGEWNTMCVGRGNDGVLNTAAATNDDIRILGTTLAIFTGPDLVCNTAAAPGDVQVVAVGASPAADIDGDGLEDRRLGSVQQQAGTLMHELGHNLRLCHGGTFDSPSFTQCNLAFKPNYLSIMNYSFQMRGIPPTDPDGTGPLVGFLDYSPDDLPDLVEANTPCTPNCGLSEPAGIGDGTDSTIYFCPSGAQQQGPGTGAINWNCDPDSTDTNISVDIDGNGTLMTLTGFDDWNNLKFDFQNTGDFADGEHITTVVFEEIDFTTYFETSETIVPVDINPTGLSSVKISSRGSLPVTILTDASFDATTVDPASVCFGDAETPAERDCTETHGRGHIEDVDLDGDLDLQLHYDIPQMGVDVGDTHACLIGRTFGGLPIEGCDFIRTLR